MGRSEVGHRYLSPSAAFIFDVLLNEVSHYQVGQPVRIHVLHLPVLGLDACSTKCTTLNYNRDLKIKFRFSC